MVGMGEGVPVGMVVAEGISWSVCDGLVVVPANGTPVGCDD